MTFIETVPEDEAVGAAAEMYALDRAALGYLPNFTRAFSCRPAVYAAWRQLNGAIQDGMDLRLYELATAAAARCFFSKTLDALGVQPDARYAELAADVREALTVGRPIATS
jgi:hypothetical protein